MTLFPLMKGTPAERIADLRARLESRLPGVHRPYGPRPRVGQHDAERAYRGMYRTEGPPERSYFTGHEYVMRNRTATRWTYVRSRDGFMSRSGITSSARKGERWAAAVNRLARLDRIEASP